MMKNIVTSTSDFEKLIESKALYIDKTDYLFSLISKAPGMFFCSRPRRFGKTLTLYTLEAIFKGLKTANHIYIIEFKCNQTADVALSQIHTTGYADQFKTQYEQTVHLLVINFSKEEKNIDDWKEEIL